MKKKIGLLARLLSNTRRRAVAPFALAVVMLTTIQPLAAQERGYGNHERFYDGRGNFAYGHDYRVERDWRAREYREQVLRDRAFREQEWRERERIERGYGYGYRPPVPYVGFQFYGR